MGLFVLCIMVFTGTGERIYSPYLELQLGVQLQTHNTHLYVKLEVSLVSL